MDELIKTIDFKQIFFRGKRFEKKAILDGIDHLANYLQKNIVSSSPFILFTACNHIKALIAYYAIIKANKIAVVLDPEAKSLDFFEIVKDVEPAAIITIQEDIVSFDYCTEVFFRDEHKGFLIQSDLKDVCTLVYTNAEDGYPKAAMLTEKNLLAQTYQMIRTNKLTADAVTCAILPFSHLYGLVQGILVPTHAGASAVISEMNILKIKDIINELGPYKITHFYTVPSLYYIMSKVPGIEYLSKDIHDFYSGGGGSTSTNLFLTAFFKKQTEGLGKAMA
jgi:long-subunit acyl-CoA synthetase (AMP-forming)